ncbi:hypothetical protein ACLOJK_037369 [Asimina triloba]
MADCLPTISNVREQTGQARLQRASKHPSHPNHPTPNSVRWPQSEPRFTPDFVQPIGCIFKSSSDHSNHPADDTSGQAPSSHGRPWPADQHRRPAEIIHLERAASIYRSGKSIGNPEGSIVISNQWQLGGVIASTHFSRPRTITSISRQHTQSRSGQQHGRSSSGK